MTTQDLAGQMTSYSLSMVTEVCISCGIPFSMPLNYRDRLKETHVNFYCPNGHPQYYASKTEAEKLQEQLYRKENELAQASAVKIQLESQLNKANKKLNKVAQGQCPCCDKTYKHLANHIARKHPELKKQ